MERANKRTLRVEYLGTRKDTHTNKERPIAGVQGEKYPRNVMYQVENFTYYQSESVKDHMGSLISFHGKVDTEKPWSLEIEIIAPEPNALSLKATLDFCSVCSSNTTLAALERSRDNCGTCDFFYRLSESCILSGQPESHLKEDIWSFFETDEWPLWWLLDWNGNTLGQAEIDLVANACDIPNRGHLLGSCEQEFGLVSNWLRDCNCGYDNPTEPHYMPTRLLEIKGPQSLPSVCLRDSKDVRSEEAVGDYRYMTLSHCWGPEDSPRFKTTPQNIRERKTNITWADIPRTFQDAILFTYRLGVSYLWIDSLCIIQDEEDFKDWQAESGEMFNVYSRSYLNIAAANAAHANVGLFRDLSANTLARPSLLVPSATEPGSLLLYAKASDGYGALTATIYPWLLRAWTYQERYLSPRSVIFFNDELVWLCNSSVWKQGSGGIVPTCHGKYPDHFQMEGITRVQERWLSCVVEYSKLQLTFEKDRLPAIGGIATHLQQYRSGRYYAGIWTDGLCFDLCWSGKSGAKRATQRAPSWSWASVLTHVDFDFVPAIHTPRMIATLVAIHCDYLGANPMGEVSGGHMQLRAPYLKLQDKQWAYEDIFWRYFDCGGAEGESEWRDLVDAADAATWNLYSTHVIRCEDTSEYDIDLSSEEIIFLQLCEMRKSDVEESNVWILHLMLRKVESDGVYERVGYASYKKPKREEEDAASGAETSEQTVGDYLNPDLVVQPEILVTII